VGSPEKKKKGKGVDNRGVFLFDESGWLVGNSESSQPKALTFISGLI
jgi:hypothetical protein